MATTITQTNECYTSVRIAGTIGLMNDTIKIDTPITPRQNDALTFIREHIADNGYPPTVREIASYMGYSSTRSAADLLQALHFKGAIRIDPNVARGIRLMSKCANINEQ